MSKSILVVEDQEDNRQIIRDMLTFTDYEITEAESGEQAIGPLFRYGFERPTAHALTMRRLRPSVGDHPVARPAPPRQLLAKIRQYLPE